MHIICIFILFCAFIKFFILSTKDKYRIGDSMHTQSYTLAQLNKSILPVGLGCMGMSEFYGESDDKNSIALLDKAFNSGVNFWDTADTYGFGHNEALIGQWLKNTDNKQHKLANLVIASKFGIVREQGSYQRRIDNTPQYIEQACHASLQSLGVDCIDLYYCHRRNPETPIEEMMESLASLVHAGKIKSIGLSEVSADTIRKAHAVHPLTAVQSEYSLWTRDAENEVIATCKELGITFVAYSPLGRAFLTGKLDTENLDKTDFRQAMPRMQGQSKQSNQSLVNELTHLTKAWQLSNAQVCLAWMLNKHAHVIPIAGTRQEKYLLENAKASKIQLTTEQIKQLDELFHPDFVEGNRYPDAGWVGIEH